MSTLRRKSRPLSKTAPAGITPARWVAFRVVYRTFAEEAWTDRAFAGEADRAGLVDRDRAFAQRLAYGAVQRAGTMEHIIARVGKRPIRKIDPLVLNALRLGMYELLETAGADHSAVDQTVEIVRAACGERPVPFANAILRRGQADGPGMLAQLSSSKPTTGDPEPADIDALATYLSMPRWLVEKTVSACGNEGIDALAAQNIPSPTHALRVNALHPDATTIDANHPDELLAPPEPFTSLIPEARTTTQPLKQYSNGIADGLLIPQSLASMLVCAALDPQPDESVLDMCAAPGNKSTNIAARMHNTGSILACELHESRTSSIAYLASKLRVGTITTKTVDATSLSPETDGPFDRVLVDAPCSGTGVLSRRPDSRWRRTEEDLQHLIALQRQLLSTAITMTRPGGIIVYSTCSILREENEDVVEHALAAHSEITLDPLPDAWADLLSGTDHAYARTWPHRHPTDGFFIARLRRGNP